MVQVQSRRWLLEAWLMENSGQAIHLELLAAEKEFGPQAMHVLLLTAADVDEAFPAGHCVQGWEPVACLYLP